MAPRGARKESLILIWLLSHQLSNALTAAGSEGLRISHLHSIIRTQFGQEHVDVGIKAF